MKNGLSRFTFYLEQVKVLFDNARKQNNPSLWLFTNNARTPFFMLESLAKIYAEMHNPQMFGKLKEEFKFIEDGLGQTDYYNWLSLAIDSEKKIPADNKQYIKTRLSEVMVQLNEAMNEKSWLSSDFGSINKITEKLNEADWMSPEKEVKVFSEFYKGSVDKIIRFVTGTNYHFVNVENDVHELRRKLRWLSIYPQSLRGAIQFAPDIKTAAHLEKYLTEEIINSPYNRLPDKGNNTSFLMLHKNYFLSLSWMIQQLGNLKDEGLLLIGLCESITQITACRKEEALSKAYAMFGGKQRKMQEILDDAESVTRTFFNEKNLQHIIAVTA